MNGDGGDADDGTWYSSPDSITTTDYQLSSFLDNNEDSGLAFYLLRVWLGQCVVSVLAPRRAIPEPGHDFFFCFLVRRGLHIGRIRSQFVDRNHMWRNFLDSSFWQWSFRNLLVTFCRHCLIYLSYNHFFVCFLAQNFL